MATKIPVAAAGAVALGFKEAMDVMMDAVAEQHGNQPGPWLDELRAEAIRRIKGTVGEGMHIHQEVALIRASIEAVEAVFDGYAKRIGKA
jgi:hypothetical protein